MAENSRYTIKYKGFSKLYGREIEFNLGQTYASVGGAKIFLEDVGVDTKEGNLEYSIKRDNLYKIDLADDLVYAFGRIEKV